MFVAQAFRYQLPAPPGAFPPLLQRSLAEANKDSKNSLHSARESAYNNPHITGTFSTERRAASPIGRGVQGNGEARWPDKKGNKCDISALL